MLIDLECCFMYLAACGVDLEVRMAKQLAEFHWWHSGCEQDQREPLPEQHDHSQTAEVRERDWSDVKYDQYWAIYVWVLM